MYSLAVSNTTGTAEHIPNRQGKKAGQAAVASSTTAQNAPADQAGGDDGPDHSLRSGGLLWPA